MQLINEVNSNSAIARPRWPALMSAGYRTDGGCRCRPMTWRAHCPAALIAMWPCGPSVLLPVVRLVPAGGLGLPLTVAHTFKHPHCMHPWPSPPPPTTLLCWVGEVRTQTFFLLNDIIGFCYCSTVAVSLCCLSSHFLNGAAACGVPPHVPPHVISRVPHPSSTLVLLIMFNGRNLSAAGTAQRTGYA